MSQIAFGTNSNLIAGGAHNPVWYLSAVNESVKDLKAQVWFYQAQNMMNSWWLQADYKYGFSKEFGVFGAAQYLNQQGIGTTQNSFKNGAGWSGNTNALYMYCNGQNANAKNSVCSAGISNSYIGVKAGIKYENAKAYIAFSDTALNNNAAMDGSLIVPWGGFQQNLFTSFMVANPTAAGTKATLYKVEYDFDGVLKGLYAGAGYALYAANSSANDAFTTMNPYGINSSISVGSMGYNAMFGELRYNLSKNLMLRWQLENDSMLGQVIGRDAINFTSLIYRGAPYMAGFDGVDYTNLKTLINHKVSGIKDPIRRYAAFDDPFYAVISTDFNPSDISLPGAIINHWTPSLNYLF
jgi:hypothetical protein